MKLLRRINQSINFDAGSVATIGNFDGVHRGHQAILSALQIQARRLKLPMVVVLFEPQPAEYFNKSSAPVRLYRLREKLNALKKCGVDYVYCLKFNQSLAMMSAFDFADKYIFSYINVKYLLLGHDFRFGHKRCGDFAQLENMGRARGIHVEAYADFCVKNVRVSSTQIRNALHANDLAQAHALLGRAYGLCGRVVSGRGIGRQWGIPTANLSLNYRRFLLRGVFCVSVKRENGSLLAGVANVGNRPTVDGTNTVLEIHLFDFNESLYGEMLEVCFLHKLRDELLFSSVDALIEQIHTDVIDARKVDLSHLLN